MNLFQDQQLTLWSMSPAQGLGLTKGKFLVYNDDRKEQNHLPLAQGPGHTPEVPTSGRLSQVHTPGPDPEFLSSLVGSALRAPLCAMLDATLSLC